MVSLELFAGTSLKSEHGPLTGPAAQRRRVALLALLAASYPRGLPREKLMAYLWPERDSDHARNLLSQAAYALRKALGEEAILAAGDELRFNPEVVACDVVSFEQALAAGELARAAALYSGPFLDGFFLSAAPEFEQWADGERERYRRAYGLALEGLAEKAAAEGNFAAAAEWWRRRVAEEPYNARVTARLMEALEAAGDRAGALQQARIHAALVEQEFAAEPDPEVQALAERLRSEPAGAAAIAGEARLGEPQQSPAGKAEPEAARVPRLERGTTVAAETPTRGDPFPLSTPPPTALQTLEQLIRWQRVAVPSAVMLGLLAVLRVGWLLAETSARPAAATEATAAGSKSIAVLPCANLSGDPEQEYFSDGLTEELTGVLAQVHSLRVSARTSAFAFKGENRDIREIGRALNVGTVLECSVRRAGERVRVTAQLINAADGFHLWTQTYEREGTDVFAIQSDLALRIAGALKAELTPTERARLARRPTESPEAHALYLKGRHFWNQRTPSGYARAIEYFERAIQVDPQYAAPYAGVGLVYLLQSLNGNPALNEAGERTKQAALKALELDDELSEAHVVLGGYFNLYAWDSEAAEREFLRAIALDPSYPYARYCYAVFLTQMHRFEEAIAQRKKAIELDPLDPHMSFTLGSALRQTGRAEEALEHLRNAIELDSTYWQAHAGLGAFYATTGQFEEAIRAYRRAVELNPAAKPGLARTLALAGRKDEARVTLAELQAEAARTGIFRPYVAAVFVALDDVDGALEWLERSYRQKHPALRFISRSDDPRLANDPRYLDLLRRSGLPY